MLRQNVDAHLSQKQLRICVDVMGRGDLVAMGLSQCHLRIVDNVFRMPIEFSRYNSLLVLCAKKSYLQNLHESFFDYLED